MPPNSPNSLFRVSNLPFLISKSFNISLFFSLNILSLFNFSTICPLSSNRVFIFSFIEISFEDLIFSFNIFKSLSNSSLSSLTLFNSFSFFLISIFKLSTLSSSSFFISSLCLLLCSISLFNISILFFIEEISEIIESKFIFKISSCSFISLLFNS